MASTMTPSPPGTPSRDSMSGSPIVTPRTKVARFIDMMASDSEDDDVEEDITVLLKKAAKPPPGVTDKKNTLRTGLGSDDEDEELGTEEPVTERRLFNPENDTDEDSDMDAEEEEEIRPRGKLAARMMAAHKAQAKTKKAPAPAPSAPPREHRSLFGRDEEPSDAEMQDQEDFEEDVTPAPIRKRALKQKRTSPTPSPTATPTAEEADNSDDEEDEQQDTAPISAQRGTPAFAALVARKRAEREAREAAEAAAKSERLKNQVEQDDEEYSGSDTNHYANSQKAPSRRRAGKKAMEEIHKETQRMARSMQLAHQATTRKKITKQSLFDKFNFRTAAAAVDSSVESVVEKPKPEVLPLEQTIVERIEDTTMDDAEIPLPNSQLEAMDLDATPSKKLDKGKGKAVYNGPPISLGKGKGKEAAFSPPRLDKAKGKEAVPSPPRLDKGKGKAPPPDTKKRLSLPPVRVILPSRPSTTTADDSDSDLEILPNQPSTAVATFIERQKMIRELRKARRPSPPRAKKAGQLSAKELQMELVRKGRQQAEMEREEHIQELRAKGIIVPTAEEREKEKAEVDDLLEKARQEALKIKRAEKRQEKLEKGLEIDDDDEEDEDWADGDEEDPIIELLSGSDEEGGDEEEMDDVEEGEEKSDVNDFSDDEKREDGGLQDPNSTPVFSLSSMRPLTNTTPRLSEVPSAYIDDEASDDSDGGEFAPLKKKKKQQRKKMCVISDDEEEEAPPAPKPVKSKIPSIFRRPNAQPPMMMMGMGMTQLFESTMGNPDDVQIAASQAANPEDRINLLRRDAGEMMPNTQILDFGDGTQSQSQDESAKLKLDYSQSQKWPVEDSQQMSKVSLQYGSDEEDMPDPTQDQGFTIANTPAPPRFTPEPEVPSTLSTQVLDEQFGAQKKRRGRLVRKDMDFSDEEEEDEERVADSAAEEEEEELPDVANLFDLMKRSSKKQAEKTKKPKKPDDFDKSKSEAKGMVQEQAEESEDEYAGIGGASDDDADNGHDSEMEDMVDDTNGEAVDENDMAAFYAEREKAQDAKDVTKLLKDMQSGFLRKKRGANFDLDDSEDEDDAEARRRAAKRRQIAKMRKELLKDENIEKIAANPKRAAFLAAIEDRDRDEEMDFLDRGEEDLFIELGMVSQTDGVSQSQTLEESEEASPVPVAEDEQRGERSKEASSLQASNSRRTANKTKITSLAQIREQLSFLVEERDSQIDFSDEDEEEDKTAVLRRERIGSVIDRSAVARANSATSNTTKLAFQTSGNASTFKVPTLLRRATSSSLSESSVGTERTLGQGDGAVKRGGKASSSINFQSREQLRSKVVHEREAKKKIERKKEGLKRQSVLGVLAKGSFS